MANEKDCINYQLIHELFQSAKLSACLNFVLCLLVAILAFDQENLSTSVLTWMIVLCAVSSGRFYICTKFVADETVKPYSQLHLMLLATLLLSGVLWGGGYWYFQAAFSEFQKVLMFAMILGLVAESMVSLATCQIAFSVYAGPICFLTMLATLFSPVDTDNALFATLIIFNIFCAIIYFNQFSKLFAQKADKIEQDKKIETLEKESEEDFLTGVLNRNTYELIAEQQLLKAHQAKEQLAILLIDVDYFKEINDKHGRQLGDVILKKVAKEIEDHVKDTAYFSRIGGDEFAVLFPNVKTFDSVEELAARILMIFRQPLEFDETRITISLSIGIACYPREGQGFKTLEKKADLALQKAKENGRGQYMMFKSEFEESYLKREAIYEIIQPFEETFTIYYQPVFIINNGQKQVVGSELLLRSKSGLKEGVNIQDIINIAEQRGLMAELGLKIIDFAFSQISTFPESKDNPFYCINLSIEQIEDKDFLEKINILANQFHINPNQIVLELTDISLIKNNVAFISMLTKLRKSGFKIAIDDIAQVTNLPIDIIKINMILTHSFLTNSESQAMMSKILEVAKNKQCLVIAEGVETAEQLNKLKELGISHVQGYLLAKPMPKQTLIDLMDPYTTSSPN